MPDYIRRAIIAQGKVDPDEVEESAALVDLHALEVAEQLRLADLNVRRRLEEPVEESWWNQ